MNPRRLARSLALLGVLAALGGCASTINGTTEKVRIDSAPQGATVRILPDEITVTTPAELELPRKYPHTLLVSLDGHVSRIVFIDRITSTVAYGNLLVGGMIGMAADADSGGMFDLEPDDLMIELRPLPAAAAPAQPAAEGTAREGTAGEGTAADPPASSDGPPETGLAPQAAEPPSEPSSSESPTDATPAG